MAIQIKNLAQLESMRKAGLLVRETLDLVKENIKPGITTSALDAIAEANIRRGGGFLELFVLQSMKKLCMAFLAIA